MSYEIGDKADGYVLTATGWVVDPTAVGLRKDGLILTMSGWVPDHVTLEAHRSKARRRTIWTLVTFAALGAVVLAMALAAIKSSNDVDQLHRETDQLIERLG